MAGGTRAKLVNIQRGNEAKLVRVSSRRRYIPPSGHRLIALLTDRESDRIYTVVFFFRVFLLS